jgi:hypothetical protein
MLDDMYEHAIITPQLNPKGLIITPKCFKSLHSEAGGADLSWDGELEMEVSLMMEAAPLWVSPTHYPLTRRSPQVIH